MAYLVSQNDSQDITTRLAIATFFHLSIHSLLTSILPFNLTAATKVLLREVTSGCSVQSVIKGKVKAHPRTCHEGPEGE